MSEKAFPGASSGPSSVSSSSSTFAPLPRCPEHPRRELDLFCKACITPICSTCVDNDHQECQQRWDRDHVDETPRSIVFEGIEKAARRLKQDVLGGLSARSLSTEQQLRQAARAVADRTEQVDQQLQQRVQAVEQARDRLLRAVTERCEGLIGALHEAAGSKRAVLATQQQGLEGGASALKQAREAAGACLESLDVDERPVEVVRAYPRLMKQLESALNASAVEGPMAEADLGVELDGLVRLEEEMKGAGWAGAMEPDPSKCAVSVVDGSSLEEGLCPGEVVKLRLKLHGKEGGPARADVAHVTVREQPSTVTASESPASKKQAVMLVKPDSLSVEEQDGGRAFDISCSIKDDVTLGAVGPRLCVQVKGLEVLGSPVILSTGMSRILHSNHMHALRGFLSGGSLRLCYRASRDGWGAADFHRCCDGQGSTVVVVKEKQHSYIFGGYTSVPWSSNSTQYADPSAFLFSMKSRAGMPPVMLRKDRSTRESTVVHRHESGPAFGDRIDLYIADSPNTTISRSNLLFTFLPPTGQNQFFLAASHTFLLSEFEVFVVT